MDRNAMTNRLYYSDSYCREFDARVVGVQRRGDRQAVRLDQSGFYPTSGGQPFDTGTIDSLRVVDVLDEDGDVVHLVEAEPSVVVGQQVQGRLDWPRRFDHMQQHSGQHVLSAAFVHLHSVPTVSFHLGSDISTIDLAGEMTAAHIAAAENEANLIVWENRSVSVRYASADDAATLGLRKQSQRVGTLRLVDVEQFDLSACGGSHVARTGEIGIIAVRAWARFKGGQRLEVLCGGRVLSRFRQLRDTTAGAVRLLSVLPEEVPTAIEHLQAVARDHKRALVALESELARYRADELATGAEPVGSVRLVLRSIDGDAASLKLLASAVTAHPGCLVILISRAEPVVLVVARSQDVSTECDEIVRSLVRQFGGRGGGKPDLAQAGGLNGSTDAILSHARRQIL